MYLGDDVGGSSLQVGTYHRLAQAIRHGCLLRPRKAKRCFQSGSDGADALGAAMAAIDALGKKCTRRQVVKIFPELGQSVAHPVSGHKTILVSVVFWMNDCLDCPREDVADWLCRVGGCKHEIKGGDLSVHNDLPVHSDLSVHKEVAQDNFHNLAEAMRRGCLLRPKKVKRMWKSGTMGACAVGAIAEGAGFRESNIPWDKMWKMFPELKGFMCNPLSGRRMEVWRVISMVSEETNCSREQIADWLCFESGCTHSVQTSGLNLPTAA